MRDIEFHVHFGCALENDTKKIRTTQRTHQAKLQFQGLIYRFLSFTHKHSGFDIAEFPAKTAIVQVHKRA